ncbi:MAG: Ig-like domain-containing protein [Candidatus Riflebacteria bacterium]|nr:Ig-like domain-containing protein [Candidatus Riflebacteria bacterium]
MTRASRGLHLFLFCLAALGFLLLGCGGGGGLGDGSTTGVTGTTGSTSGSGASAAAGLGTIFGRVTGSQGLAAPGTTLTLSLRGTPIVTAVADSLGNYFLQRVPTGQSLLLTARPPSANVVTRQFSVILNPGEPPLLANIALTSTVPTILTSSPAPNSINVPVTIQPLVVFNVPIAPSSLTTGFSGSVQLNRLVPTPVITLAGTIDTAFDASGKSILFKPKFPLTQGTEYEYRLGSQVKDQFGSNFGGTAIRFKTQGTAPTRSTSGPTVLRSTPIANATGVSPDTVITLTFDRPVDPSTVTTANILFLRTQPLPTLEDSRGRIRVFQGSSNTFEYIPSVQLTLGTSFSVIVVENGIRDTEGNYAREQAVSFRTRSTGPRILFSNPGDGQPDVATTLDFIQVTFDETLKASSATNRANYTLSYQQRGGSVTTAPIANASMLVSPPNSVRLDLSGDLLPNTGYSLRIANLEDKDGNPSGPDQKIQFFTTNLGDNEPPRIISATPTNGQADVNLNSTLLVSWSEPMSPSVTRISSYDFFAESGNIGLGRVDPVTGAANTYRLTPLTLPLAPSLRHTLLFHAESLLDSVGQPTVSTGIVFVTAAGNANLLDRLNSTPRDGQQQFQPEQTGNVLVPRFTRRMVQSSIEDVNNYTLTEAPNSRVAISYALAQSQSGQNEVILQPGRALRPNTEYTLQFSNNLQAIDGTRMPANTSLSFKTGAFGDVENPSVVSWYPRSGAQGVSVTTPIQVQFSEAMGPSATVALNYYMTSETEPPFSPLSARTLTSPPNTIELTFRTLKSLTDYTLTVTTLVKDLAGNTVPNALSSGFTTGMSTGGSLTPPTIVFANPGDGASGISTGTFVILRFDQDMYEGQPTDEASVLNRSNYTLASDFTGQVPLNVDPAPIAFRTYRIRPAQSLRGDTEYIFLASNSIQNTYRVPLTPYTCKFKTASIGDSQAPNLLQTIPQGDQRNVNPADPITLFFSEAMNLSGTLHSALTLTNYALYTSLGVQVELASVQQGPALTNTSFRIAPAAQLASQTRYTFVVGSNLRDIAGNAFQGASISFTTGDPGASTDVEAPQVVQTNPGNGQTVTTDSRIFVTFSEAMRVPTVVATSNYVLYNSRGSIGISGVTTAESPANTYALTPYPLAPGLPHTLLFTSNLRDLAGNALIPAAVTFVTTSTADTTPPELSRPDPNQSYGNVDVEGRFELTFNEPMDPRTVTSRDNYLLTTSGGTHELSPFVVQSTSLANTVVVTTLAPLLGTTDYTLTLSNRLRDLAGNALRTTLIRFRTREVVGGSSDVTPPSVVGTVPSTDAAFVGVKTLILVTFSEPVNVEQPGATNYVYSALNPANYVVRVSSSSAPLTGVKIFQMPAPPNTFEIRAGILDLGALYQIQLSDRIRDLANNALVPHSFKFYTGDRDSASPRVLGSGYTYTGDLYIQFNELMTNSPLLNTANYQIVSQCYTGAVIPTVDSVDLLPGTLLPESSQRECSAIILHFTTPLDPSVNATYRVIFAPVITDLAGNAIDPSGEVRMTTGTGCGAGTP